MSRSPSKIFEVFDNPNVDYEHRKEGWTPKEVVSL